MPKDGGHFDGLIKNIVRATNWQNKIDESDLKSNEPKQIKLDRQLRKLTIAYLRKRESIREARRRFDKTFHIFIKKDDLAQSVAACQFDPILVREGKESLFDEHYDSVFGNESVSFYLSRYFTMIAAKQCARGYPSRYYMKWLTTHFGWKLLSAELNTKQELRAYVDMWRQGQPPESVYKLMEAVYKSTTSLWKKNRGVGDSQKDVNTYFKQEGLHDKLTKHWHQKANAKGRNSAKVALAQFRTDITDWLNRDTEA